MVKKEGRNKRYEVLMNKNALDKEFIEKKVVEHFFK
jgi:hypothetical protein